MGKLNALAAEGEGAVVAELRIAFGGKKLLFMNKAFWRAVAITVAVVVVVVVVFEGNEETRPCNAEHV
jgi:anti-sigma-K factor RskA